MNKLLISIYLLLLSVSLFAKIPAHEVQALKDFYLATQGDEWNQSWDLDQDLKLADGLTIEDGHVVSIRLMFNNLQGQLPASISELTELRILELSFNKINGTLPASIGELKKLEILALNGNDLEGSIPSSYGKLNNLVQLHLSSNKLHGNLPDSLSKLEALEVLNVFDNQLSGSIPKGIAKNRKLKELMIAENQFENSEDVSTILLSKSGHLNLNDNPTVPATKTIIANELSDDEN